MDTENAVDERQRANEVNPVDIGCGRANLGEASVTREVYQRGRGTGGSMSGDAFCNIL
jgi:hypothetical protein